MPSQTGEWGFPPPAWTSTPIHHASAQVNPALARTNWNVRTLFKTRQNERTNTPPTGLALCPLTRDADGCDIQVWCRGKLRQLAREVCSTIAEA